MAERAAAAAAAQWQQQSRDAGRAVGGRRKGAVVAARAGAPGRGSAQPSYVLETENTSAAFVGYCGSFLNKLANFGAISAPRCSARWRLAARAGPVLGTPNACRQPQQPYPDVVEDAKMGVHTFLVPCRFLTMLGHFLAALLVFFSYVCRPFPSSARPAAHPAPPPAGSGITSSSRCASSIPTPSTTTLTAACLPRLSSRSSV